jgi:hypothetical protein
MGEADGAERQGRHRPWSPAGNARFSPVQQAHGVGGLAHRGLQTGWKGIRAEDHDVGNGHRRLHLEKPRLGYLDAWGEHEVHFAEEEANRAATFAAAEQREGERIAEAALEADRRITVRKLFDRWVKTELKPEDRANGTRLGRKDAGAYTRAQFERRVFEPIGEMEAKSVTKGDLMDILDSITADGKLRTANVLLADLKQMFRFAVTREIVERNPLESVTKKDVGGAEVGRDRVLSDEEVRALAKALPQANLTSRSQAAIWLILATGCRISASLSSRCSCSTSKTPCMASDIGLCWAKL